MRTILLSLFLASKSCSGQDDEAGRSQVGEESKIIQRLATHCSVYAISYPGVEITNLLQLLEVKNPQELIPWENDLRARFSADAGFENSVLEKYVFMPAGARMADTIGGELVLISSRTFPGGDGKARRAAVFKLPDRYRGTVLDEPHVQKMLHAAGLKIPKPALTEPIPRPPPDPIDQAWKQRDAQLRRDRPELFRGSPKQRTAAFEKYTAELLNPTNPPPAESGAAPLAFTQPPVPPASDLGRSPWPLLVLAFGALGGYFF